MNNADLVLSLRRIFQNLAYGGYDERERFSMLQDIASHIHRLDPNGEKVWKFEKDIDTDKK